MMVCMWTAVLLLHVLYVPALGFVRSGISQTFRQNGHRLRFCNDRSFRSRGVLECATVSLRQSRSCFVINPSSARCLITSTTRVRRFCSAGFNHGVRYCYQSSAHKMKKTGGKALSTARKLSKKHRRQEKYTCERAATPGQRYIISCKKISTPDARVKKTDLEMYIKQPVYIAAIRDNNITICAVDLYKKTVDRCLSFGLLKTTEDTLQVNTITNTIYYTSLTSKGLYTLYSLNIYDAQAGPKEHFHVNNKVLFVRVDLKRNVVYLVSEKGIYTWKHKKQRTSWKAINFRRTYLMDWSGNRFLFWCIRMPGRPYVVRSVAYFSTADARPALLSKDPIGCMAVDPPGIFLYVCKNVLLKFDLENRKYVSAFEFSNNLPAQYIGKSLTMIGDLLYAFDKNKRSIVAVVPRTGNTVDMFRFPKREPSQTTWVLQ